ncbi:MAG: protein translocase subunit SecD [Saprospiraceae bacterium]|nr:protein translocase subunit SecD [Saprospiraceae bacterium]
MQAKGIIKFFLVLLLLICAAQFIYYIPTNRVERDAENYAKNVAAVAAPENKAAAEKAARLSYLDSMSSEKIWNVPLIGSYTYQDLKSKQLALGLDLKGGMSVLLQVDLKDFLVSLSGNSTDPNFTKAIENANAQRANSTADFITLFVQEYKKLAGDNRLASIFARNESLKQSINIESSDNAVQNIIRQKADETVGETFKRLTQRIDKLGVVQPNVSLDKSRDIIVVELPGIENPERARSFLQKAAKLEFWEVYRASDNGILAGIQQADNTLKAIQSGAKVDSLSKDTTSSIAGGGPLLAILQPNPGTMSPAVIGSADKNKRKQISEYLTKPEVASKFPSDLKFVWSKDPVADQTGKATGQYELYALKKTAGKEGPALDGERVTDARANSTEKGGSGMEVSLQMDAQGAATWGQLTSQCARDNNREVAIVLDEEVVSAPRVISPILEGRSSITGNYSVQEAQDLASILQVGKLPAKAEIIQENTVGPSLGAENIRNSVMALGLSFLAILAFMVIYYSTGGFISIVALFANLFFIIGSLTSYGTVLTLPGIAGILLTMAMAVDANVIIYERIREELAAGKSTSQAIADGFKHSMSAVIDGHVTGLLTSLVLIWQGIGAIKGFGVVLAIGVIFTLFTAILVSRLIVDYLIGKGKDIRFFAKFSEGAFKNIHWDWMAMRKKSYAFSLAIIAAGLVSFFVRGFELGVDFTGGYKYEVAFDRAVNADQLRDVLTKSFEGQSTIVKAVNSDNTFDITTSYMSKETGSDAQDKVLTKLHEGVNSLVGGNLALDNFKSHDVSTTHIKSSVKVGPTVADDIKRSSLLTTLFGVLIIGAYILIRFNRWQYSLGLVIAALHDVLITVAFFTLLHGIVPWSMEINQDFIAALLTIIGFSVNDTVIVYDRIREYMRKYTSKPVAEVINDGINSTLSRTIITSLTVLIVTFILFLVGGASIKGFAFALFIGMLAGTYSSIFVAAPIMMDFSKNLDLSEYKPETTTSGDAKKKTLKEKA